MKKHISVLGLILFVVLRTTAQQVETVAGPNPRINNGLTVGPNGDVFASDFFGSGFNGQQVNRITPNGETTLVATGLSQPAGLAFDQSGQLFVAEFTSGEISKIDSEGEVTLLVDGLNQPADLIFDDEGNLFVTNYGNGVLSKITPEGVVSTFATGLSQPVGITKDENGIFYVANLNTGEISKINELGEVSSLAVLDQNPIGFITYAAGHLYVTCTGCHRIYQVTMEGVATVYGGTGATGNDDGSLESASFTNPDGIASDASGDTLYISENNTNLLRRIIPTTTGIRGQAGRNNVFLGQSYPNPVSAEICIPYQLLNSTDIELAVYSSKGRKLKVLIKGLETAGEHNLKWSTDELTAGLYYYQIAVDGHFETKKFLVLKK